MLVNKVMNRNSQERKIRVILKGPHPSDVDSVLKMIVDRSADVGVKVEDMCPLPRIKKKFTILQSPHVNKNSRQVLGLDLSRRMITFKESKNVIVFLRRLDVHKGVNLEIKLESNSEVNTK